MLEKLKLDELIMTRAGTEDDRSLIMATWLKGLRFGNDWFNLIPSLIYYREYHKVIDMILYQTKTQIKIACLKEDPDTILGYSVYNNDVLHWVFVKKAWRNIGIAKSIVPQLTVVTHLTNVGKAISKKKGLTFNPFVIN